MSRSVSDYVALAFVGRMDDPADIFGSSFARKGFQGDWSELKVEAEKRCGFQLTEQVLRDAVRTLAKCGLVRISEDRYAGEFVKIYPERFSNFIEKARNEEAESIESGDAIGIINRPSDYPNANALALNSVFEDYSELGDEWLRRALNGLKGSVELAGSLTEYQAAMFGGGVPASDRVVRFDDNSRASLESNVTEIIQTAEASNSLSESDGLKELVVGQLKAGRELIRAGSVKFYILQITLIDTLNFLAKRYENEVIGALASTLAVALAKHLGLDV